MHYSERFNFSFRYSERFELLKQGHFLPGYKNYWFFLFRITRLPTEKKNDYEKTSSENRKQKRLTKI